MIGKILLASLAVAVAVPDLAAARSAHRHRPKAQAEARIACTVRSHRLHRAWLHSGSTGMRTNLWADKHRQADGL
jgi:hypothetical protein